MEIHGSALVTGASRGIGRAVALELAQRGFDTVATMRDPGAGSGMAEETAGRLEVRRLDVTDPATFDLPGDLRVLVNNAGIDTEYLPVEHADIGDWRRMFETNVFGTVALTSAAIPILRDNRPSVVCNVTAAVVDAIVERSGPMRYGCDPVAYELIDLWRQSDDETVFALMGQSLLDLVPPEGDRAGG